MSGKKAIALFVLLVVPVNRVTAQVSKLLEDPDIRAAEQAIHERNTVETEKVVKEAKTVQEVKTISVICHKRCGLFGRRRRRIRVQRQVVVERQVTVERTVKVVTVTLDTGIGWDRDDDPRLGGYESTFPIKMLPKAAGARGTKINRAASAVLKDKDNFEVQFGSLDRVLVRLPKTIPGPPGARELVRVIAKVGGLDDENVIINVRVQRRNAAGILIDNKDVLDKRAETIWKEITGRLNGVGT